MQKVMVVDDEEVLRMLIVDTLEDLEDVEIHTAENGREALSNTLEEIVKIKLGAGEVLFPGSCQDV